MLMPTAYLEAVRLKYELTGDPALPVLVLSHSLGVNMNMWKPQLEALSTRFRLLLYDTRGHGASSFPPGPYKVSELAGDVLALMDYLEIESAHFCGLSMGGSTGQWLGIHVGDRIKKLVLANTAVKIGTAEI
jgi:3-oxoadipate enol-lactonase